MGVRRTDYIFYGSNVGYDNVDCETYEAEIDLSDDRRFDIIYDGMSGNYAYAGKIIAVIDQYDGRDGSDPIRISELKVPPVLCDVVKSFPDAEGFGFYFFSHFS